MSFVTEHVRKIEDYLEKEFLLDDHDEGHATPSIARQDDNSEALSNVLELQSQIKRISTSLPAPKHLQNLTRTLSQAHLSDNSSASEQDEHRKRLEWFFVAKATAQVYGYVLDALIKHSYQLYEERLYWNEIIDSRVTTSMYLVQTYPQHLWKFHNLDELRTTSFNRSANLLWEKFYNLVGSAFRGRLSVGLQSLPMRTISSVRVRLQRKLQHIDHINIVDAERIGFLLINGFRSAEKNRIKERQSGDEGNVVDPFSLGIDSIVQTISTIELAISTPESAWKISKDEQGGKEQFQVKLDLHQETPYGQGSIQMSSPGDVSRRLLDILQQGVIRFQRESKSSLESVKKPSFITRYWLPGLILLTSSSTLLRIIVNRRAEIKTWIKDLLVTSIDFWRNWVIEPAKKIVETIHHDDESTISITSKRTLQGDKASLERMVVEFATETHGAYSETDLDHVRSMVQAGDLTPVLKAYEQDMKSPFYSSLRGTLIRTLLIQVQKTKVDIEVAMTGIDNLLKSQELVFGLVGLTPGVIVCLGTYRWIKSIPDRRKNSNRTQIQSQSSRVLRNIDRIVTRSLQSGNDLLSTSEYGLLICEANTLRHIAQRSLPRMFYQDFLEDFDELINRKEGVIKQLRVADRIRWAYLPWM